MGVSALCLYLWLAPPVSGDQDASELTLALALQGVPHPTGYPLYAMLGHGFCVLLHALGATWSYAANAWSAVGGGVAIAFLHAVAARLLPRAIGRSRAASFGWALLPAGLFALDPVWTMSAALAEIHSWHLAWAGGICLLYVRLASAAPSPHHAARDAAAWGFVVGLGLAHHVTAALMAAPLTVALGLLWARSGGLGRRAAIALAAFVVPLLSYAFVAFRAFHPAPYQWPLLAPSWRGVIGHVLGGGYGHFLGRFEPSDLQRGFLAAYVYPLLIPGLLALALVALRAKRRPERFVGWGFLAAALVQLAYVFQYGVPDPAAYFLPPLFLGLLAIPAALALAPLRGAGRVALAAGAALVVLLLTVPWLRVATERREGFVAVDRHLRALWRALPFDRGIVLWPSDMHTRFREYQLFDHEKPRVFVSSPNLLTFERPRADFERRFGFDPLAGIAIASEADVARIAANVNRRTRLPVVEVDAMGITDRLLPKP